MAHSKEQRQIEGLRKLANHLTSEYDNLNRLFDQLYKEKIGLEKEIKALRKTIDERDEMIQCLSNDIDYYRTKCDEYEALPWYRKIFIHKK